jgi:hypothetical protein
MAPDLVARYPVGENVIPATEVTMEFNEVLSKAEIVLVSPFVGGDLSITGSILRFTPSSHLSVSTEYIFNFRVFDLAGNKDEFLMKFTTSNYRAGNGGITGEVVDTSANPLSNVRVKYDDQLIATTDEDGRFRVELPVGKTRLEFSKDGYRTTYSDIIVVQGVDTDSGKIEMKDNQEEGSLDARIIILAVLLILIAAGAGSVFLVKRTKPDEPSDIFLIEGEDYFDDEFE